MLSVPLALEQRKEGRYLPGVRAVAYYLEKLFEIKTGQEISNLTFL